VNPILLFGLGFIALMAGVALYFAQQPVAAVALVVAGAACDLLAAFALARSRRNRA